MTRIRPSTELRNWLYRLDSYTNEQFGHARSLLAIHDLCVGCGAKATDPDVSGLCRRCAAQRRADQTEVVLFRPLRRRPATIER